MASNAEDLLSCPICFERFQDPRLLHCGHTFCLGCLDDYHKESSRFQVQILCPTCRSPTQLPQNHVNSLPKDFRIGQFQDVINQSEDKKKEQKTYCVLCKERNETREACRLCTDCKRDFCSPCAVRHATVPAFNKHNIISMPTGDMASLRYCGSHSNELLMYDCISCAQFVCSLCITDTHVTCDVRSVNQSLSTNHDKLKEVLTPLLENEDVLNSYLRDYNIIIQKLNETHDTIDRQARAAEAKIQKARQDLQNSLATYEQEQVAKLMTSLSADGSVDAHSYQQLCEDLTKLTNSNDPWTVAMESNDLVAKATNVNQSLERMKKKKNDQGLQFLKFLPTQDSFQLGTLNFATIDPADRDTYPGCHGNGINNESQRELPENCAGHKWDPVFHIKTEGTSVAQVNKPTDVAFTSRDTIAVSDYGNSRYTTSSNAVTPFVSNASTTSNNEKIPGSHVKSNPYQQTLPASAISHTNPTQLFNVRAQAMKRTLSEPAQARTKVKRTRFSVTSPKDINTSSMLPGISSNISKAGVKVTGLPSHVDTQQVLEVFGFDIVLKCILKETCSMNWSKTAWILYINQHVANSAVQKFHYKFVLGNIVQVRLCDAAIIEKEAHDAEDKYAAGGAPMELEERTVAAPPLIDLTNDRNILHNNCHISIRPPNQRPGNDTNTMGSLSMSSVPRSPEQNHLKTILNPNQTFEDLMETHLNCFGPNSSPSGESNHLLASSTMPNIQLASSNKHSNQYGLSTMPSNRLGLSTMPDNQLGLSTMPSNQLASSTMPSNQLTPNINLSQYMSSEQLVPSIQPTIKVPTTARDDTNQPATNTRPSKKVVLTPDEEGIWTCPDCYMFNFYWEPTCSCGYIRPQS